MKASSHAGAVQPEEGSRDAALQKHRAHAKSAMSHKLVAIGAPLRLPCVTLSNS